MKKQIKLNENKLRQIIRESVKNVINENQSDVSLGKIRFVYYQGQEIDPRDLELQWENNANKYGFNKGTLYDYEAYIEEDFYDDVYQKGYDDACRIYADNTNEPKLTYDSPNGNDMPY